MFQTVAIPFDAFRDLPTPQHRWLLTCLSRYCDRHGKCFPTQRQLAEDARMSLSTVCRRLKEMADLAVFQRTRRGSGRYVYTLAAAYLPRWPREANSRVSASGKLGVSGAERQREVRPTKQADSYDEGSQWKARLRSWIGSGFWLPQWGPRPNEPGCWAPQELGRVAQRPVGVGLRATREEWKVGKEAEQDASLQARG